ncbi:MAG: hypothetical protein KC619_35390 [Myxococcales bacterium]|nr:hypothetical protein [Myxococcales bacterium]
MAFERVCVLLDIDQLAERAFRAAAQLSSSGMDVVELVVLRPAAAGLGEAVSEADRAMCSATEAWLVEQAAKLASFLDADVEIRVATVLGGVPELAEHVRERRHDLLVVGQDQSVLADLALVSVLVIR